MKTSQTCAATLHRRRSGGLALHLFPCLTPPPTNKQDMVAMAAAARAAHPVGPARCSITALQGAPPATYTGTLPSPRPALALERGRVGSFLGGGAAAAVVGAPPPTDLPTFVRDLPRLTDLGGHWGSEAAVRLTQQLRAAWDKAGLPQGLRAGASVGGSHWGSEAAARLTQQLRAAWDEAGLPQRVGAALDDALAAPPARRVGAALQDGLAAAQSQGARLPLLPLMEERLELLRQDGQAAWPELSTQQVGGYPLWQIVAISAGVSALVAASVPPEDQQR